MNKNKGLYLGAAFLGALLLGALAAPVVARSLGYVYGNALYIENEPRNATPSVTLAADGAFIAGTIEVDGAGRFDGATNLIAYPGLTSGTTTSIALLSKPIGTIYLIQERVAGTLVTNAYNFGVSTAANVDSCVYLAVSTSAQAAAGAACRN